MAARDSNSPGKGPIRKLKLHSSHQTNDREPIVLVYQDGAEQLVEVAAELEPLGFQVRLAKGRSALESILDEVPGRDLVTLLHAELTTEEIEWLTAALPDRTSGAPPTLVVAGPRPEFDTRAQLRSRGIQYALWQPYDDNLLRFVLNEALGRHGRTTGRSEPRVPTTLIAQVGAGQRSKQASVYNLSLHGAFLQTSRPTPSGAAISVEVQLSDGPLRIKAEVAHTNVPGNLNFRSVPVGMGVRFTSLSSSETERLRRFVSGQLALFEV